MGRVGVRRIRAGVLGVLWLVWLGWFGVDPEILPFGDEMLDGRLSAEVGDSEIPRLGLRYHKHQ